MRRKTIIGVIGASEASEKGKEVARQVGREIARAGAVMVCGGLGGVMEAAARGCAEEGGEVLGLLPGPDPAAANPWVTIAVPTNIGYARNIVITHTAAALIAVEGEYGTLSEVAIGLKLGRPVLALDSWNAVPGVQVCTSAQEAVSRALSLIARDSDEENR